MNSAARILLSSAGLYFVATLVGRLQFFVTLPLVSRYLPPAEYGLLTLASALAVAVATTVQATVAGAVERLYADTAGEARQRALGTAFTMLLGASIAVGAVGMLVAPWVARRVVAEAAPHFVPLVRLATGIAVATALGSFSLALLRIEERPALALVAGVTRFVLAVAGVFVAVGVLRLGAAGYLGALLLAELGVTLGFQPYVHRRVRIGLRREVVDAVRAYSWPLAPYVVLAMLRDTGDRWLLEARLPLGDVGLYGIAWGVAGAMNVVVGSLTIPYAATMMKAFGGTIGEDRRAALLAELEPQARQVLLIALGCYALFLLAVQDVVGFLVDPAYAQAWIPAAWLAAVYLLRALYLFPHNALHWMRRTRAVPVATFWGLLAGAPIIYLTAPALGVVAAPVGLAVSYLVSWAVAGRSLPDRRWAWPVRVRALAPGLAVVAMAAAVVLVTATAPASAARFGARAAAGLLVAAVVIHALVRGARPRRHR